MKIIVKTKDEISDEARTAHKIRDYVASITKNDSVNKIIMSHNPKDKHLIFAKPYQNSFAIIDYYNRHEIINKIALAISANKRFYNTTVNQIGIFEHQYNIPAKQTMEIIYRTRTPIVLAVNDKEIAYVYRITKHPDAKRAEQMLQERINRSLKYMINRIYGIEYQPSVKIKLMQYRFTKAYFKPDDEFPLLAVNVQFASDHTLPAFVGYKNGFGFGHIYQQQFTFSQSRLTVSK